jgi:hypothetical protein
MSENPNLCFCGHAANNHAGGVGTCRYNTSPATLCSCSEYRQSNARVSYCMTCQSPVRYDSVLLGTPPNYCATCLNTRRCLLAELAHIAQSRGYNVQAELRIMGRTLDEVINDSTVSTQFLQSILAEEAARVVSGTETGNFAGVPIRTSDEVPEGAIVMYDTNNPENMVVMNGAGDIQEMENSTGMINLGNGATIDGNLLRRATQIISNPETRAELERLIQTDPALVSQMLEAESDRQHAQQTRPISAAHIELGVRSSRRESQREQLERLIRQQQAAAQLPSPSDDAVDALRLTSWSTRAGTQTPKVTPAKADKVAEATQAKLRFTEEYSQEWLGWFIKKNIRSSKQTDKYKRVPSDIDSAFYTTIAKDVRIPVAVTESGEVYNTASVVVSLTDTFSGKYQDLYHNLTSLLVVIANESPEFNGEPMQFSALEDLRCTLYELNIIDLGSLAPRDARYRVELQLKIAGNQLLFIDTGMYDRILRQQRVKPVRNPASGVRKVNLSIKVS